MKNYFRITAYHPANDINFIMDSNGRFTELGSFAAYLIKNGCKVIQIGRAENFQDGNFSKIEPTEQLVLRACAFGNPERNNGVITLNGRFYRPM